MRYYSSFELKRLFENEVGETEVLVDGFFGLGIQKTDLDLMPLANRMIIHSSEFLKKVCDLIPACHRVADSLYIHSHTRPDIDISCNQKAISTRPENT